MKKQMSLTLDENLVLEAEKIAREQDRSISWVINEALKEYLLHLKIKSAS